MIDPRKPDYTNTPVSRNRPSFGYAPKEIGKPVVSIITPFYNTGEVFHETAQSVLGQSLQQFEWIIVNDGTKDTGSLAILESYRHHADKRIRVIDHEVNRGLSASRNTGFAAAVTDYVLQIDSDDLLEPTAAEKMYWFLESHPEYEFVKGYTVGFGAQEYLWEKGFEQGRDFLEENQVDATAMIRKKVHGAVGGYDETSRDGLEDWDFWLRCAAKGYWGKTIPEFLDWYRRREDHGEQWKAWNPTATAAYREGLRKRYPQLWNNEGWVRVPNRWHKPNEVLPDVIPGENHLDEREHRILFVLPWMTLGGADKFNLDLLQQLSRQGRSVSIVTTLKGDQSWMPEFGATTPDIFVLSHFLRLVDYPRFIRYLIQSRAIDTIVISNSELGYLLLPYLRSHFPSCTFVDYCHMEEEHWKNGGYPGMAVDHRAYLDLTIVSSEHLRRWMVARGGDIRRIEVCTTNIDPDRWTVTSAQRLQIRERLGVADETPIIFFAGRLVAQKQPKVLLNTLKAVAGRGKRFLGIIAGDGPELEFARSFVAANNLSERVRVLGRIRNEEVREIMLASDVFFLPSEWEGIALSVYEAMAAGCVVVGADVGGQRELVVPETGILINKQGPDEEEVEYAEHLCTLIDDPKRLARIGQGARARIKAGYDLKAMGTKFVQLLELSRHMHRDKEGSQVPKGLGVYCAKQAIEYTRLFQLADQMWAQMHGNVARAVPLSSSPTGEDVAPKIIPARTYFVLWLRELFYPLYEIATREKWPLIPAVLDRIRKYCLG